MENLQVLVLVSVLLLWTPSSARHTYSCGDSWCRCSERFQTATCRDHGYNLTYIPRLPDYITSLEYTSNYLHQMTYKTFENISSLRLTRMQLTYNHIEFISPEAFSAFSDLTELSLNGNPISNESLLAVFDDLSRTRIGNLSLEKTQLTDTGMFQRFNSTTLSTLILDRNNLTTYNHYHLRHLTGLARLSLRYNHIQFTNLTRSDSLESLHMNDNYIQFFPDFCFGDQTYFPNLGELNLNHNALYDIVGKHLRCLKNLHTFSINTNRILKIYTNTFAELPKLSSLILRNLRGDLIIEAFAFNNSNIEYISLTSSKVHFKTGVNKDAFRGLTNIQSLDVSYNVFHHCTQQEFNDWFAHLTTLTGFGLGGAYLFTLPEFISHNLLNVIYLKLYENALEELPPSAFRSLTKLTHLWLSNNNLAKLSEDVFPPAVRQRLQVISLMYNPFACNCELLWFLNWTKYDSHKFQGFPNKYVCHSPGSMSGTRLSEVHLSAHTCLLSLPVVEAVLGCSAVIVLSVILLVSAFRLRWKLRYLLWKWKHRHDEFTRLLDCEVRYGAYVIYHLRNISWIKNELINKVEGGLDTKLFIRDRDSLAGDPKVDNVVNHMAASRACLVILSNAMAADEECLFELMFAQNPEGIMNETPIIVVLLEEVRSVSPSIYALLATKPYITWGTEADNREYFWNRLRDELQKQPVPPLIA